MGAHQSARMTSGRQLVREEIENVWAIDRSEVVDNIYYCENGMLVLKPAHYDIKGWPPGEVAKPYLVGCQSGPVWPTCHLPNNPVA